MSLHRRLTNNSPPEEPTLESFDDPADFVLEGIAPRRAPTTKVDSKYTPGNLPAYSEPAGQALVPQSDGTLEAGRYRITRTGMELPDDLTEAEWREIGKMVKTLESSVSWVIGDWAAKANKLWGISYEEIARQFDYGKNTLKQYASVCNQVHPNSRHPRVPFSHHRLVTSFSSSEQKAKIKLAIDPKTDRVLTLAEFRAVLAEKKLPQRVAFGDDPVNYVDAKVSKIEAQIMSRLDDMDDDAQDEIADIFQRVVNAIRARQR